MTVGQEVLGHESVRGEVHLDPEGCWYRERLVWGVGCCCWTERRTDSHHCAASACLLIQTFTTDPVLGTGDAEQKMNCYAHSKAYSWVKEADLWVDWRAGSWTDTDSSTERLASAAWRAKRDSRVLEPIHQVEKQGWLSRDTRSKGRLRKGAVRDPIFIYRGCWSEASQTQWLHNRNRLSHDIEAACPGGGAGRPGLWGLP